MTLVTRMVFVVLVLSFFARGNGADEIPAHAATLQGCWLSDDDHETLIAL